MINVDARFSHLLRTTIVLSDIEMREIQETMYQERDRISLLELLIEDLKASIDQLSIERAERYTRLDAYKIVITPVRRLPLELVIDIFRLYCPTRIVLLPNQHSYLPQLVISEICSGWRKVALELNELWHCVSSQLSESNSDSDHGSAYDDSDDSCDERVTEVEISQSNMNLVEMWLSRVGSLPSLPLDHEFDYDNCDIADEPIHRHTLTSRPTVPQHQITHVPTFNPTVPRFANQLARYVGIADSFA